MLRAAIKKPDQTTIAQAVSLISDGQPIVFPTETVYGLAADANNDAAIERLYQIKCRDTNKPLQIMVPTIEAAREIAIFDKKAEILARNFWPGPLTIVMRKAPNAPIAKLACPPSGTIGIRIPANDVALKILRAFGRPLAATSANLSGEQSCVDAPSVAKIMDKFVPLIIDGGACSVGISSTVVDASGDKLKILREGSISESEILSLTSSF